MNPDTQRPTTPVVPPREGSAPYIPPRTQSTSQQDAAANVVRSQIDAHFQANPQLAPTDTQSTPTAQTSVAIDNPYHHTHSTEEHTTNNDWQHYHSAWQQYYQQYYERYYVGAVYKTQAELTERAKSLNQAAAAQANEPDDGSIDKDEALYDIRSKLRDQITTGAKKVRKSRHFVPIILAACVMLTFAFLQYNSLIFASAAAYVSPGNVSPANIIVDPNADINVGPNPELIIPKINVDAPIDFNTDASSYDSLMNAMKNGVAYFGIQGADARPGEVGNFGISGHSSNDLFDTGGYKFVFVNLTRLEKGDSIYINYQGKRYTYSVTGLQVVAPNDAQSLVTGTTKPTVTLITCTPAGTALHRLLVTATQVSPDPSAAPAAPSSDTGQKATTMPGNAPTLLEQMFGAGG